MVARPLPARQLTVGFLETIGQGHKSRREDTRPAAAQPPIWDDSLGAIHTARTQEPRRSNRPDAPVIWIAVLVGVAAVGVAAWLGIRNGATPVVPTASAAEAPSAEPTPVNKQDARPTSTRRRESLRSPVNPDTASSTKVFDGAAETPEQTSTSVTQTAPFVNVGGAGTGPGQPSSNPSPTVLVATLPEDNFVYSSQGTGVTPPRLMSLGFPQPLVRGFDTRTSTLELLVSKIGTVERAKISSPSRNWQDAMLLSRAKTFQFVPAQRNGDPVRYRFVMTVDTTP
jgi:hypothetical protein